MIEPQETATEFVARMRRAMEKSDFYHALYGGKRTYTGENQFTGHGLTESDLQHLRDQIDPPSGTPSKD